MVGRQGPAHLRTDAHSNGRKVNVSSVFDIGCASVHPQRGGEFPCVMEHDDRDVSIRGPYDVVVGVSNIVYAFGVEAARGVVGVFFGVVATKWARISKCVAKHNLLGKNLNYRKYITFLIYLKPRQCRIWI